MELEIVDLTKTRRHISLDELDVERMSKLRGRLHNKSDNDIIKDAIAHLLGTLERDQPIWPTAPSEGQKAGRRPPRDAA